MPRALLAVLVCVMLAGCAKSFSVVPQGMV